MDDIIFKLNIDESNKILKPIVEIFSGKIKTLKSKRFSGPLKSVDVGFINNALNLSLFQKNIVFNILNEDENTMVSRNKFILSEDNLLALFKALNYSSCIYYTGRDRSMNLIEELLPGGFEVKITAQKEKNHTFSEKEKD